VFEYKVSGGDVSTRPGARDAGDRESSLVTGAVQSAERIARRRFREAGPGVPWRAHAPRLCWQAAIQPSRPVPRPDRPAQAACPRAAQMRRPRRAVRPAASRQVWLPARVRGTACWLARRAENGYQPRCRQGEDTQGHDEHRRRTWTNPGQATDPSFAARPRVPRTVPVAGAAGGHAVSAGPFARVARVTGRAAQGSGIPPQTCISS